MTVKRETRSTPSQWRTGCDLTVTSHATAAITCLVVLVFLTSLLNSGPAVVTAARQRSQEISETALNQIRFHNLIEVFFVGGRSEKLLAQLIQCDLFGFHLDTPPRVAMALGPRYVNRREARFKL